MRRRKSRHDSSEDLSLADSEPKSALSAIPHQDMYLDDMLPSAYFKRDILRTIHALRIPRWNHVCDESADDIEVDRISNALTNNVYRVSAPSYTNERIRRESERAGLSLSHQRAKEVPQLLLRVYGPRVDVLVDRDEELEVLAQLTKQGIGAKLLGIFSNGRFEQFLNAKGLVANDLRDPETSRLIARRMREMHDNIPLLPAQRLHGPKAFRSVHLWKEAALKKLAQLSPAEQQRALKNHSPEELFEAFEAAEKWMLARFTNPIAESLVFTHNDTQYGNILRLEPPAGSPLLQPDQAHRQLVVIDFEFSGPNCRAFDISNHFCEWMSDYQTSEPHKVQLSKFPSEEEQFNFINAYVLHGAGTDNDFDAISAEIEQLLQESKAWRPFVSGLWLLWGIIQAPINDSSERDGLAIREQILKNSGLYDFVAGSPVPASVDALAGSVQGLTVKSDEDTSGVLEEIEIDQEFDYIGYSSEKASLFWQDLKDLRIWPAQP